MTNEIQATWHAKAKALQQSLDSSLPIKWSSDIPRENVANATLQSGLLSQTEGSIITMDAWAIRDAIADRSLSSVEVTLAFAKAAALVHQATNCLMYFDFNVALERATQLDKIMQDTGKPVGPLHGLPISVKGHVGLEGTPAYVGFLAEYAITKDAILVDILRQAGAVFIVKTTVPQGVLHLECEAFHGATLNAHNTSLTSGGSSGGEGALIGGGGSCLGIGSDIGGSIRVPAAHNGIFGFKPTVGRLPRGGGGKSIYAGQDSIIGTTGPMGRSARDLELFMRVILEANPWEMSPVCMRMPWRTDEVKFRGAGNRPRIGVLWHDGVVQPLPPMRRALKYAVDKLKASGFEVKAVAPYRTEESWRVVAPLYLTDGGANLRALADVHGEPLHPLTDWLISQGKEQSVGELLKLNLAREAFRSEYLAHFRAADVDVILCPPFPGPAPKLNTSRYWSYTAFWNLVDYPAGTFPTGLTVDASDEPDAPYAFWSEADKENWQSYDSPTSFANAPLSLQLAGPRWEDEKVVLAIQEISKIVLQ